MDGIFSVLRHLLQVVERQQDNLILRVEKLSGLSCSRPVFLNCFVLHLLRLFSLCRLDVLANQ
jgi:hypothetical protein